MKTKIFKQTFLSILITSCICIISFSSFSDNEKYSLKGIDKITSEFRENLTSFVEEVKGFEAFSQTLTPQNQKKLKDSYVNLRKKYKTVEFLLEYLDKEAIEKTINGAPLPKIEKKAPDLVILQPKGLQVIDELMAEELSPENIDEIKKFAKKLTTDSKRVGQYLKKIKFTDRQFFEASRQAIVRIATLGITGFDTPGTLHGVADASIVLTTIKKAFSKYKPQLKNVDRPELFKNTNKLFTNAIIQCNRSRNFETLDRLSFLKKYINPLYKNIKEVHLALNYETIYEVRHAKQAINYNAQNLFDPDFLDAFNYVGQLNDSTFQARAHLGKLLFFDPILSVNNSMACANCHHPQKAFTDGRAKSISNNGKDLVRNSMTLNYTVFSKNYFHDMRTSALEDQFEHVIVNEEEFNTSYKQIIQKLSQSKTYKELFKKAFPKKTEIIETNDIDYVLAAYIMQLNTFDSDFDQYMQGKTNYIATNVRRGFNLFTGKAACATCHFMPIFNGTVPPLYNESESEVLGVPLHKDDPLTIDKDIGRYGNKRLKEKAPHYKNSFKTPTIRNIALTSPYMHNGVFETLEEVMDFYNKGGGAGQDMKLEHQTLSPDPLNLTEQEISDIIAFMNALTDQTKFEVIKELPNDFELETLNKREPFSSYDQ